MMVIADANGRPKGTELTGYPFYLIFEDYEDNKVLMRVRKRTEEPETQAEVIVDRNELQKVLSAVLLST